MFLQDKHADLHLETGESREIWWIADDMFTIMSDCPGNFPRTVLHTLSFEDGISEYQKLVSEGWNPTCRSDAFMDLERAHGKVE